MAGKRPRRFVEFYQDAEPLLSFSSIAPMYWRCAERLLREATGTAQQFDARIIPAICLYHAVLECYLNEELALSMALGGADETLAGKCRELQDDTLNDRKLRAFLDAYGVSDRFEAEILNRTVVFTRFRNKLHHHSPELRPSNLYPKEAAAVFHAAGVEAMKTSWVGQSMNVKVGNWSSETVRLFIEEFCRCTGRRSSFEQPGWTEPPAS